MVGISAPDIGSHIEATGEKNDFEKLDSAIQHISDIARNNVHLIFHDPTMIFLWNFVLRWFVLSDW